MEPFKSKSKILKDSRRFQQLLNHYAATGRWRSAATLLGDLAWLRNPLEDLEVEGFSWENIGKIMGKSSVI